MKPAREIACECVHPGIETHDEYHEFLQQICARVATAIEAERARAEKVVACIPDLLQRVKHDYRCNAPVTGGECTCAWIRRATTALREWEER